MKRALFVGSTLLLAVTFSLLGLWQVERRAWKLDLIARVEERLKAPPEPIRDWRQGFAEYRRVRLQGTYLCDRETLVKAVTERGEGFWVMTPLHTLQGAVLINRGFVPSAGGARWCGGHQVEVVGLQRSSEPKGGFLRSNDPVADRWYSRDVTAIARARGIAAVAPFFVDADATPNPGGYPIGGMTVVAFRNNHLVYALTWFALAVLCVTAAIFGARQAKPR